jgi:hypothetical protein
MATQQSIPQSIQQSKLAVLPSQSHKVSAGKPEARPRRAPDILAEAGTPNARGQGKTGRTPAGNKI